MEVSAQVKTSRIAPRKARLVVDLIRNRSVVVAVSQLEVLPKRAAGIVLKLLNTAVASARHNHKADSANLAVVRAFVDQGVTIKRWRPRAFGRAGAIRKRTSHITIVLGERQSSKATSEKIAQPSTRQNSKFQAPNTKQIPNSKSQNTKKEKAEPKEKKTVK